MNSKVLALPQPWNQKLVDFTEKAGVDLRQMGVNGRVHPMLEAENEPAALLRFLESLDEGDLKTVFESGLLDLNQWWFDQVVLRYREGICHVFLVSGSIHSLFLQPEYGYVSLPEFLKYSLQRNFDIFLLYEWTRSRVRFSTNEMAKLAYEKWGIQFGTNGGNPDCVDYHPRQVLPRVTRMLEKSEGLKIAVVISDVEELCPCCDTGMMMDDRLENIGNIIGWSWDSEIARNGNIVFLISGNGAYSGKLQTDGNIAHCWLNPPNRKERTCFLYYLHSKQKYQASPNLGKSGREQIEELVRQTDGFLSLVSIRDTIKLVQAKDGVVEEESLKRERKRMLSARDNIVKLIDTEGIQMEDIGGYDYAKRPTYELMKTIQKQMSIGQDFDYDLRIFLPGSTGVGKSMFPKAMANCLGLPLVEMGEIRSKWVGDTEKQFAEFLRRLAAYDSCVIWFIDEIDFEFQARGSGNGSEHHVERNIFKEILKFTTSREARKVILIAASNRPDMLDPAQLSRMNVVIPFLPPSKSDLIEIYKVRLSKGPVPVSKEFSSTEISQQVTEKSRVTIGPKTLYFSGREVKKVVSKANMDAISSGKEVIEPEDLFSVLDNHVPSGNFHEELKWAYTAISFADDRRNLPEDVEFRFPEIFTDHKLDKTKLDRLIRG